MSPAFSVQTRCECQASLSATLTEQRFVVQGTAQLLGKREPAPAHSIHPENEVFDIGFLCPFCNRNVLRTFRGSALARVRSV